MNTLRQLQYGHLNVTSKDRTITCLKLHRHLYLMTHFLSDPIQLKIFFEFYFQYDTENLNA